MDLATIGLVAGSGWASGVNLYAAVALLGVFGRLGAGPVPDPLMRTDVIVIAFVLFSIEFVADKIPVFDSFWDALHTVIRPLGALVLGLLLSGEAETWQQAISGLGAGGLATASHVAKATTRAAINTSPEPATNVLTSLAEDGLVVAVIWFAVANPILALIVVTLLLIGGALLTVMLFRAARRGIRAYRERRRARQRAAERTVGPPTR